MSFQIIHYKPKFEQGWLRCRVLSFLNTQYYNDVRQVKEEYNNDSIELIAVESDKDIGLIDVEIEKTPGSICNQKGIITGMLWHIAIHPDYQRMGIGEALLNKVRLKLLERGIKRLEAWTKEDEATRNWYYKNDFKKFQSYYHVTMKGSFVNLKERIEGEKGMSAFSHFTGDNPSIIEDHAEKIEECIGFVKVLEKIK